MWKGVNKESIVYIYKKFKTFYELFLYVEDFVLVCCYTDSDREDEHIHMVKLIYVWLHICIGACKEEQERKHSGREERVRDRNKSVQYKSWKRWHGYMKSE